MSDADRFVVEAKGRSNDPDTGGWAPGWRRTSSTFSTRGEAEDAIKKRGRPGADYRVVELEGAGWNAKDERQYKHILKSCRRSKPTCRRIAAATVNKQRSKEGRTMAKRRRSRGFGDAGAMCSRWCNPGTGVAIVLGTAIVSTIIARRQDAKVIEALGKGMAEQEQKILQLTAQVGAPKA